MTGVKTVQNGVSKNLADITKRSKALRSYLNTTVYTQYQNFQMKRWMSQGSSEGDQWKPLSKRYEEYKKRRYGGGPRFIAGKPGQGRWKRAGNHPTYPGRGTKMLIATGTLVSAVVGPMKEGSVFGVSASAKNHRKLVGDSYLEIKYNVPYGREVNEARKFHGLSKKSNDEIVKGVMRFLVRNTKPPGGG
jgi:hypothetical protein